MLPLRNAVLKHLRIPASLSSQQALAPSFSQIISRGFAGELNLLVYCTSLTGAH